MTLLAAGVVIATFLTSILSGIFGMAGGIVMMGILAWLLPVQSALALHGVIQFASNAGRALLHRRYLAWRVLGWFALGVVAANLVFALVAFAPEKFYIFLGLGLMPILVWLPERWFRLDASRPVHAVTAGLVSTGLALVSGVSGPVTDLFFIRTELTRHQVVATKALMQAAGHASKIVVYGAALTTAASRAVLPYPLLAVAMGAAFAGTAVGAVMLDRMTDAHFHFWRRWIVTVVGLSFLVQAIQLALT